MSKYKDQDYLRSQQYKDASNLNARINLHRRFSTNPRSLYRWIFDQLNLQPHQDVLELGCGPGDLWLDNVDRLPAGCRVILADLSPGMLYQAQKKLSRIHARFEFLNLDAQHIPLRAGVFDLVIANFMIYHIPDRSMALSESYRVLELGGRFFAATNGEEHMREIKQLVHRIDPDGHSESVTDYFGLENGGEQLLEFFRHVTLHRFEDSLFVTEVDPLVAYMRSMHYTPQVEQQPEQLAQLIERQIQEHGGFFIGKAVGMFESVK